MSLRTAVEQTSWYDEQPDEEVVWDGQSSPTQMYAIIAGGVLIAIFGAVFPFVTNLVQNFEALAYLLIPFGLLVIGWGYLRRELGYFVVTNKRVLIKKGVLGRHSETSFADIKHVHVNQPPIAKLASVGDVVIYTAGTNSPDYVFRSCNDPYDVKNQIQALLSEAHGDGSPAVEPTTKNGEFQEQQSRF